MKQDEPPLVTVRWGGGFTLQFIGWGFCIMAAGMVVSAIAGNEMWDKSVHRAMTFIEILRSAAGWALIGIAAVWGGRRIRRLQDAQEDRDQLTRPPPR